MKIVNALLSFVFTLALFSAPLWAEEFKVGKTYEGFKLIEKRFVKEVDSDCLYFVHAKSGARLFKILSNDDNKTFAIAFKTDPESNWGTPHIIEHSVLNGSKSFPVKSPYDVLRKGSLLTFINAFTGDDMTCFPVASKNDKDYFNLMHVYLDAVFQPRFKTDDRILKQEGWHYEMEKADGPVTYKGVVYNEMKGAFSDPVRELNYQVSRTLFPDNGYKWESGGYPQLIPGLTQEAFVKFHDKYYHPSNSHILLYGNGDLLKEMSFIDREYLSKYSRQSTPDIFPLQKPFSEMKKLVLPYPVSEGTETANQTYLSFSAVVGQNQDRALVMALNTICDVLINQEAGPIRIALQKAGIGKDVSAYVDEKRQNVFNIQVQNANTGDMEKFFNIITEGLKEAAEKGLDKKAVEGSISRAEFALREGNSAQKGLNFAFQIIPGWFFAGDPYLTLEYEKHLAKLKSGLKKGYLEEIIKKQILSNPHSVLAALEPKPGLDKQLTARSEQKLKSYAESLSKEEKEKLVNDTRELIAYQKREDTPEALATIPMLDRKDINPEANYYEVKEKQVKGVPVLDYEEFANNVVYLRLYFDLRALPQELLQYAPLLGEVLGNQNTENHSFGELENLLNINTGGFSTFMNAYCENRDDNKLLPKLVVSTKSMNTKTADMLGILSEILTKTRYSDAGRLKDIITRYQARLDASIKSNGLVFTQVRAMSYYSNAGMFNETVGGIDFYKFITDLSKTYDQKSDEIKANLAKAAELLFNSRNMVVSVTGSAADCKAFEMPLADFIQTLPSNNTALNALNFTPVKKNEGFQTASKVQYVIEGYSYKKLGYSWDGKMKVLNQILSRDWLQNRIRVIGGAYGGFFSIDEMGNALFMSYRDPNLKETIDNYNATADYLDKLEISETDMTRYIIGTIAGMDLPLTVSQKGANAVTNYFNKISKEDVQNTREAVLNTKPADIKAFREMIKKITEQNAICVYGNEQKISAQKEMFDKVEKLF